MNKLLLTLSILSAVTVAFGVLRRQTSSADAGLAAQTLRLASATNRIAELQSTLDVLQQETAGRKALLSEVSTGAWIRSDLLKLLDNPASAQRSGAWTDLRAELEIGWESSDKYVLVRKQVLKRIGLHPFQYGARFSNVGREVLALTPMEQRAVEEALQGLRQGQSIRVQRVEPAGDIVAHYVIPADDPSWEQGISNKFVADINGILGPERADLLSRSWFELRSQMPMVGAEPVTFTIRRAVVDGETKFIWRTEQGSAVQSQEVRYARVPGSWFGVLFPRGWHEVAEREHFELPKDFDKR